MTTISTGGLERGCGCDPMMGQPFHVILISGFSRLRMVCWDVHKLVRLFTQCELRFSSKAYIVVEFENFEPCLEVFAGLRTFAHVFGEELECLEVAIRSASFHES